MEFKPPITNKELLQMSKNHVALHKCFQMYYNYPDITYEETLERALIHYIEEHQRMFDEFVSLKTKALMPTSSGNYSLREEALLLSVQNQLALNEKRYSDLIEQFNANKIEYEVMDKENNIMEHALTQARYNVRELIGREPREYKGDVLG